MAYPESCYIDLIGIKGTCEPKTAQFWLDSIPGMDLQRLAALANAAAPSGEKLGLHLIESAAQLMIADVEAIYDGRYKVESSLVNGCSTCNYTSNYSTGTQLGTLIKNNTESGLSSLLLHSFIAKINNSGTFTIVIDDGDPANIKQIPFDFIAGVEYSFTNVNYRSKQSQVRLYFLESGVALAQLSCKRGGSGCGCSGAAIAVSDLIYTGTVNGLEQQQAYGFVPCAAIQCDASDLLCFLAQSAPRMMGMALLYKTAALFFQTNYQSLRNNKVAGTNTDAAKEDAAKYEKLYLAKLNGKETRGVKDLVFTTLQQTPDICIVCNSLTGVAWATT